MTNPDRDELVKLADHADEAATGHDQSGHVSSVSSVLRECSTALRRLASSDGGAEPARWEWCCFEDNEQRTGWQCEGHGDQKGWEKLVESNPAKYRIVRRPLFTAPPADAGMREALERLKQGIRDIAQACVDGRVCDDVAWFTEIPAETLFDKCCNLLGEDLPTGQPTRAAPGATTKSDGGGLTPNATTIAAIEELERGGGEVIGGPSPIPFNGYSDYTPVTVRGSTSDPSSTRSEATALTKRLDQVLKVMRGARNRSEPMAVWADDIKAVEDARALLDQALSQLTASPDREKVAQNNRALALEFCKAAFQKRFELSNARVDVYAETVAELLNQATDAILSTIAPDEAATIKDHPQGETIWQAFADLYGNGNLDAEDCAYIDRELVAWRGAEFAPSNYNLISIIAGIREKTGVGGKPMLNELADAIAAEMDRRVADEREKCNAYRNALLWTFDRLSVTGGMNANEQRRTMREIGNVLTGRGSPAATYQPNDWDDSAAAIRSQEAGR